VVVVLFLGLTVFTKEEEGPSREKGVAGVEEFDGLSLLLDKP
jgi:hypothetical protein